MSMLHGYSRVRVPLLAIVLTFAFAIANAGCGGSGERSPSTAEVGRRIDEQVSSFLADNEVTGSYTRLRTVAVSVDGRRVYERYFHNRADAHLNMSRPGRRSSARSSASRSTTASCTAPSRPWPSCCLPPRGHDTTGLHDHPGQLLTMTGGLQTTTPSTGRSSTPPATGCVRRW